MAKDGVTGLLKNVLSSFRIFYRPFESAGKIRFGRHTAIRVSRFEIGPEFEVESRDLPMVLTFYGAASNSFLDRRFFAEEENGIFVIWPLFLLRPVYAVFVFS